MSEPSRSSRGPGPHRDAVPPEFAVRRLRSEEWREFRALRLDALRADPLAFGSTLATESEYPESRWQEWCRRGATGEAEATFVVPGPEDRGEGMLGVFSDGAERPLWGMWVRPESRRRGLGEALLHAVLEWLDRTHPGASVVLDVNPRQASAVRLYRRFGFEFVEPERPLGHHAPEVRRKMRRVGVSPTRAVG